MTKTEEKLNKLSSIRNWSIILSEAWLLTVISVSVLSQIFMKITGINLRENQYLFYDNSWVTPIIASYAYIFPAFLAFWLAESSYRKIRNKFWKILAISFSILIPAVGYLVFMNLFALIAILVEVTIHHLFHL